MFLMYINDILRYTFLFSLFTHHYDLKVKVSIPMACLFPVAAAYVS